MKWLPAWLLGIFIALAFMAFYVGAMRTRQECTTVMVEEKGPWLVVRYPSWGKERFKFHSVELCVVAIKQAKPSTAVLICVPSTEEPKEFCDRGKK
jgi:hypothetical protein